MSILDKKMTRAEFLRNTLLGAVALALFGKESVTKVEAADANKMTFSDNISRAATFVGEHAPDSINSLWYKPSTKILYSYDAGEWKPVNGTVIKSDYTLPLNEAAGAWVRLPDGTLQYAITNVPLVRDDTLVFVTVSGLISAEQSAALQKLEIGNIIQVGHADGTGDIIFTAKGVATDSISPIPILITIDRR